jgi:hypothetical protein
VVEFGTKKGACTIGLLSWVDTQGEMRLLSPAILRSGKGVLFPKNEPTNILLLLDGQ